MSDPKTMAFMFRLTVCHSVDNILKTKKENNAQFLFFRRTPTLDSSLLQ